MDVEKRFCQAVWTSSGLQKWLLLVPGDGRGEGGSTSNPHCGALGCEMMTEHFPARLSSYLATACSPGCFSRRVWSVLAKESLLFPKRAYRFVLDSDGNFRHFFLRFEANVRTSASQAALCWFSCMLSHARQIKFPQNVVAFADVGHGNVGWERGRTNI